MKKIIGNLLIKICVIAAALLIAFRVFVIVIGCLLIAFRSYEKNHKPDDMISEAIYEVVGSKTLRYYGKQYSKPGRLGVSGEIALYEYEIRDREAAPLLTNIVEAANSVIFKSCRSAVALLVTVPIIKHQPTSICLTLKDYMSPKR